MKLERLSPVIPAHPYEGAFYWFLADGKAHSRVSSYYRVLYGQDALDLQVRAAALTCLFPDILLAAADAHLPDSGKFIKDRDYYHPDLRLRLSWSRNEWDSENREVAKAALTDPSLVALLETNPVFAGDYNAQTHFLCRTSLQIRMAAEDNATLIGDAFFQKVYPHVAQWISDLLGADQRPKDGAQIVLSANILNVVGLNFQPANLDSFSEIRSSKDINSYARDFRSQLLQAASSEDLEHSLLAAMAKAMDYEDVAKHAASGLQTIGSAMNVIGFIPLANNIAAVAGIATDIGGRAAEKVANKKHWYLLGAEMQKIAITTMLKRLKAKNRSLARKDS